jgi:hypothetical protein
LERVGNPTRRKSRNGASLIATDSRQQEVHQGNFPSLSQVKAVGLFGENVANKNNLPAPICG